MTVLKYAAARYGSYRRAEVAKAGIWPGGVRHFSAASPSPSPPPPPPHWRNSEEDVSIPPSVNPPDAENPDPATLREQWKYAIGLYSRWYSHAWGTAILAGLVFFGLGWFVKGENPLPSKNTGESNEP